MEFASVTFLTAHAKAGGAWTRLATWATTIGRKLRSTNAGHFFIIDTPEWELFLSSCRLSLAAPDPQTHARLGPMSPMIP